MRVMGIDPGLRVTGYGCLEGENGEGSLIEAGAIRLDGKTSIAHRLVELDADLRTTLDRLQPDVVAVEKLYAHYRHPTTAITMGHARGVIFLCVQRFGAELIELGATEVKKSLTGSGHASKAQVQDAVQAQLKLAVCPKPADVADAIAVGMCCIRRQAAVTSID